MAGLSGSVIVVGVATALVLAAVSISHAARSASEPRGDPALFDPIASVVMHPRCINCHQVKAPAQTDASRPHQQMVVRGKDGHGSPALQCQACHQETNTADGRVPGAPHWHLAPLSMNWQGLSKAQICEQMKDPKRNGNRHSGEEIIEHLKVDPLVIWAWSPGADRTLPPISHAEFVKASEAWAHAGMPCPNAS